MYIVANILNGRTHYLSMAGWTRDLSQASEFPLLLAAKLTTTVSFSYILKAE